MNLTAVRVLVAPLAALVLFGPLTACSSEPERQVCAALEADGDDYVPLRDPALCPPPGTPVAADAPQWVPVSMLDDDDDDHRRTRTSTARATPAPRTTTSSRTTKPAPRTTTARSR